MTTTAIIWKRQNNGRLATGHVTMSQLRHWCVVWALAIHVFQLINDMVFRMNSFYFVKIAFGEDHMIQKRTVNCHALELYTCNFKFSNTSCSSQFIILFLIRISLVIFAESFIFLNVFSILKGNWTNSENQPSNNNHLGATDTQIWTYTCTCISNRHLINCTYEDKIHTF